MIVLNTAKAFKQLSLACKDREFIELPTPVNVDVYDKTFSVQKVLCVEYPPSEMASRGFDVSFKSEFFVLCLFVVRGVFFIEYTVTQLTYTKKALRQEMVDFLAVFDKFNSVLLHGYDSHDDAGEKNQIKNVNV